VESVSQGSEDVKVSYCIADRVWNYYQAGLKKLGYTIEVLDEMYPEDWDQWKKIQEFYKNLRVDGFFGNHNPKSSAGALLYLTCIILGFEKSQKQVAESVGVNVVTIGKWSRILKVKWNNDA